MHRGPPTTFVASSAQLNLHDAVCLALPRTQHVDR